MGDIYLYRKTKNLIKKVLKKTNIKIAFKTYSTIEKILKPCIQAQKKDKCNKSGIHQLSYPDCKNKYIGQTGRSFLPTV
jgi:hypothetical protein